LKSAIIPGHLFYKQLPEMINNAENEYFTDLFEKPEHSGSSL
jgi:hypothetical protein